MSQPNTAMQHIATQPKNATQHLEHILTQGQGKRHTTAQKAADNQHEKEAKEASETAVQESYQCIATLQAQMQADQDAAHVDAPKSQCPCARPVGKAVKALKTSDSTTVGGQVGAEIVTANKPVVTQGKGHKGRAKQLAAGANVEHPTSDEELEEESVATKTKRKKITKPLVRDVIEAVSNAGIIIDGSTKAHDRDIHQKMSDIPKFTIAGHIPGWVSNFPMIASKPASKVAPSIHSQSAGSALSKLTRGSTISSNVPPPSTPISIPNAEGFTGSAFSNLYASDEDKDKELFTKPLSHFTGKKVLMGVAIISKALNDVLPSNVTHCGVTSVPEQPDLIEDADNMDVLNDFCDQLIAMNGDYGDSMPATQPDFLRHYRPNSGASQATEYDSDLEPPPLTQKPMSQSIFSVDFDSLAASQKQKMSPILDDDELLMLLSDIELTSTTNVATMLKAPPVKQLKSESSATTGTNSRCAITSPSKAIACSAYRKKHLPKGCQMANKWAREFIPTAIHCIGDLDEVWNLSEDILCPILQSVWNAVYKGKIPHTVEADGPVIALTLQWLSEWCNTLSNVALVVLANFMTSQEDINTDQDHEDFASALHTKLTFLFGDIIEDGELSNPFQSDLLMQVLVQHKCATSGAASLPRMNNTMPGHSKGVLALVMAAACVFYPFHIQLTYPVFQMECAIKLFSNRHMLLSKESSVPLAFSDANWGMHTRSYMMSINCLPDSVILQNSELAQSLTMKRHGMRMDVDEESEDEQVLIF
ncbi:hypothetical protein BDR05DRAFT_1002702 [Suillus weaverae]|nr:hypothetical protein BDR05DRAFT_1002702 [Suillus weaverae]